MLLAGADAVPPTRHGVDLVDGALPCRCGSIWPELHDHDTLYPWDDPDPAFMIARSAVTTPPWNPLLMEWEVEVLALAEGCNGHAGDPRFDPSPYQRSFITTNFDLPVGQPDLARRVRFGLAASGFEYLSGRSILHPGPVRRLADLLQAADPDNELLLDLEALAGAVAQPLVGFHEGLLMRRAEPQLAIEDPLGFADNQALAGRVRDAVGDVHPDSPVAGAPFHPIRTGEMVIERLRLIDSFGQTREWRPEAVLGSSAMGGSAGGDRVSLPPRITQPARVHVRWLAAEHDDVTVNDHPATTPICGWLLPNLLDEAIDVYDTAGRFVGLIDGDGRWRPAPGLFGAPRGPDEIDNRHLAEVVRWLLSTIRSPHPEQEAALGLESPATPDVVIGALIDHIETALDTIEPLDGAGHQSRALLIGRPIAVVRARLDLQLLGRPACDQSWEHLRHRLLGRPPSDHGFTEVEFAVRIGEHQQSNDGTVGYWVTDGAGRLTGRHLRFTHDEGPPTAMLTLAGAPIDLTVLLDPRAVMHVTSGVLPTTSIGIPPALWAPALDGLSASFLSAPILMPAEEIAVPLPREPSCSWSWSQRVGGRWIEVADRPTVEYSAMLDAFPEPGRAQAVWQTALRTRVLEPDPTHPARALLSLDASNMPKGSGADGPKPATLDEDTLHALHRIATYIRPALIEATFGKPAVIREGWLQLRSTFADGTRTPPHAQTANDSSEGL